MWFWGVAAGTQRNFHYNIHQVINHKLLQHLICSQNRFQKISNMKNLGCHYQGDGDFITWDFVSQLLICISRIEYLKFKSRLLPSKCLTLLPPGGGGNMLSFLSLYHIILKSTNIKFYFVQYPTCVSVLSSVA